jgi:translation elongation factor EF-1beta
VKRIKFSANCGYVEDVINFEDDVNTEEIEETIKELVMKRVDWYWEEV